MWPSCYQMNKIATINKFLIPPKFFTINYTPSSLHSAYFILHNTVEIGVWHLKIKTFKLLKIMFLLKSWQSPLLRTGTILAIFSSFGTKPVQVFKILQGFHYQMCNLLRKYKISTRAYFWFELLSNIPYVNFGYYGKIKGIWICIWKVKIYIKYLSFSGRSIFCFLFYLIKRTI